MHDLNIIPHGLKIFCQEPAMAFFRTVFAAKEAVAVQACDVGFLSNFAAVEQIEILCFIIIPCNFFIAVLGQQVFGRSEIGVVFVAHTANGFGKELQVLVFCEAGELGCVTDAGVHDSGYAVVAQQVKKLPGRFVGEADGVDIYHDWAFVRGSAKISN